MLKTNKFNSPKPQPVFFDIEAAAAEISAKMTQKVAKLHRIKKYDVKTMRSIQEDYCYRIDELTRGPVYFAKNVYNDLVVFVESI